MMIQLQQIQKFIYFNTIATIQAKVQVEQRKTPSDVENDSIFLEIIKPYMQTFTSHIKPQNPNEASVNQKAVNEMLNLIFVELQSLMQYFLTEYVSRVGELRLNQINSRIIIFTKEHLPPSMSCKIDKIRRKLQENRKKSIFQNLKVNQNLSSLLFKTKTNNTHLNFKNNLSAFPAVSLCNTRDLSTDHSERSQNLNHSHTEFPFCQYRRMQHSVYTEKICCEQSHTIRPELTAKSLNPTLRINWNSQKKNQTTTERYIDGNCVVNAQTPQTVIIVTEPQTSTLTKKNKKSFRSVMKRPSLVQRKTYTPDEELSPRRKYSISAWETFQDC